LQKEKREKKKNLERKNMRRRIKITIEKNNNCTFGKVSFNLNEF